MTEKVHVGPWPVPPEDKEAALFAALEAGTVPLSPLNVTPASADDPKCPRCKVEVSRRWGMSDPPVDLGLVCVRCGWEEPARLAPPKAPLEREGVQIPAGVLGQRRGSDVALLDFLAGKIGVPHVSASGEVTVKMVNEVDLATLPGVSVALKFESCGYEFSFPRVRLEENPGPGISYQLFGDGAPLETRAPFNPAHQGGLHRWPLDLDPEAALHGKEPCHE